MTHVIPDKLRRFYEPQVEQLKMSQSKCRVGLQANLRKGYGNGRLWVAAVGDDCLACTLDLTLKENRDLKSDAGEYCCISTMSEASIATIPTSISEELPKNGALAFYCQTMDEPYLVQKDKYYSSYSFCLTKKFMNRLIKDSPQDGRLLAEHFENQGASEVSPDTEAVLQKLNRIDPDSPGASFKLASALNEALMSLVIDASASNYAQAISQSRQSENLVNSTKALLNKRMGETLTLQSIADELYVSRSRLAAIFKKETGMGVVEYLRRSRIERACDLLSSTCMSAAEIGRVVGYPRQSAFTEAFKQATGISPSAWRKMTKGHL